MQTNNLFSGPSQVKLLELPIWGPGFPLEDFNDIRGDFAEPRASSLLESSHSGIYLLDQAIAILG